MTSTNTYDHLINEIIIFKNFPEKSAMQNLQRIAVSFEKFVKIIVSLIKWLYIIGDVKAYYMALRLWINQIT